MNAVREGWQHGAQAAAAAAQSVAPELSLPLQELLARLLGLSTAEQPLKQLMFVGAAPRVGNSFVAGHAAQSLAAAFGTVLVVEVRAGAATPPVRDDATPAEALAGQGPVARLLLPEAACLAWLTTGQLPPPWQALLGSDWAQDWGLVLWDLPPLTASPAALMLARRVDGIVLLAQAYRTRRHVVQHTVQRLQHSGGRLLGVVLNRTLNFIPAWIYRLL